MKAYGIIYKITNKINGKIYIGQTTQKISDRLRQHTKERRNYPIKNALVKYGINNFNIEIICSTDNQDSLNVLEQEFINKFNSLKPFGYNIRLGGAGGGKLSESTKKLISEKSKGKRYPKRSVEACLHTSLARKTKDYDFKPKTNSVRLLARKPCIGTNVLTGEQVYFDSTLEAQKAGFHRGSISDCCNGKGKVHKGHTWRYA